MTASAPMRSRVEKGAGVARNGSRRHSSVPSAEFKRRAGHERSGSVGRVSGKVGDEDKSGSRPGSRTEARERKTGVVREGRGEKEKEKEKDGKDGKESLREQRAAGRRRSMMV